MSDTDTIALRLHANACGAVADSCIERSRFQRRGTPLRVNAAFWREQQGKWNALAAGLREQATGVVCRRDRGEGKGAAAMSVTQKFELIDLRAAVRDAADANRALEIERAAHRVTAARLERLCSELDRCEPPMVTAKALAELAAWRTGVPAGMASKGGVMAKFRRRIGTVEAVQFDPQGAHKKTLPPGVTGVASPSADNWAYGGCEFYIDTADDPTWIYQGDWLATQPDGSLLCYTGKDFRHMFEPLKEESEA